MYKYSYKKIILILFFCIFPLLLTAVVSLKDFKYILPGADSFSLKTGSPFPHYIAYSDKKKVIGICYFSTDIVPDIMGYNGAIRVLIGITSGGEISGIKVVRHRENIHEAFQIETSGFDKRYIGKKVGERLLVGRDIDNITGATVTVESINRIIEQSSRIIYKKFFKKGFYTGQKSNMSGPVKKSINVIHKKADYLSYLIGVLLFACLIFLALNLKWLNRVKVFRSKMIAVILIQLAVIVTLGVVIYSNYGTYTIREVVYLPGKGDVDAGKLFLTEDIISKEKEAVPEKEPLLFEPKWKVEKVDEEKIKEHIRSGNLSKKEAEFSQEK